MVIGFIILNFLSYPAMKADKSRFQRQCHELAFVLPKVLQNLNFYLGICRARQPIGDDHIARHFGRLQVVAQAGFEISYGKAAKASCGFRANFNK